MFTLISHLLFAPIDVREIVHEFAHFGLEPTGFGIGFRIVVHVGGRHGLHRRGTIVESVVTEHKTGSVVGVPDVVAVRRRFDKLVQRALEGRTDRRP